LRRSARLRALSERGTSGAIEAFTLEAMFDVIERHKVNEAVLDRAISTLPGMAFIQAYAQSGLSPIATVMHAREHVGARLTQWAARW
jgi:hypothetical protein